MTIANLWFVGAIPDVGKAHFATLLAKRWRELLRPRNQLRSSSEAAA
jgi:hypothetical protein